VPISAAVYTIIYNLPTEGVNFNTGKLIGDTIGTIAISYMLYVYAGKSIVQKIFDRIIKDNT
jgi:hypothetical protein